MRGPSDDPAAWRTKRRLDPPRDPVIDCECPTGKRSAHTTRRPPTLFADCPRALAMRFEAVLRAVADPDVYAAHWTLRLHKWRCRPAVRQDLFRALIKAARIVCEAALHDAHWDSFAATRIVM